ncbi:hypothetical protein [Streptomyces sp. NBC_00996]|uniref:hypothetical protein n=1 Tax=Streptomyces sp. NBC_00996 TaxID=2903710 RepID=UPI00386C5D03|nr:hypothetical protein OG390_48145 [Streptomyces sp. NBC_00996]
MNLDAVADDLYGLPPEDFTATRDARAAAARSAGDRPLAEKIRKLRRPSSSAWAANLLVRERPDEIQPLLQLGQALRQAHHDLDGEQLRELSRRQHLLINALSRQARQLAKEAGHPISDGVQREVESILHAVLADPSAAQEWAAGRLVKPFSQALGFPTVEDTAPRRAPAASTPSTAPCPAARARRDRAADEERRRLVEQARQEAADSERELRALEDEAATAGQEANEADEAENSLQQRVGEFAHELQRLQSQQRQARAAAQKARERVRVVDRQVREARRRAEASAAQVERLTAQDPGHGRTKART